LKLSDESIPIDQQHLFIRGRAKDEIFDLWVSWFERIGVPYRVVQHGNRRILYKHQTRVVDGQFTPCCGGFDEVVEGRKSSDVDSIIIVRDRADARVIDGMHRIHANAKGR
jgi:hypothetical protein